MTRVVIWNVRDGISRGVAIASMRDCVVLRGSDYQRNADACNYVDKVYKCNDRCASSANATPMGFKTDLKELTPEEFIEFDRCFNFKALISAPEPKLKLFRASIIKKLSLPSQTMQNHTLMILACTKAEAMQTAIALDPKYKMWDIILEEIQGPFKSGQIIMDTGLRVVSMSDTLITGF